MADRELPPGVKSESVTWHLADGTPTSDKKAAATAEMTRTFDDGRVEHTLLRRRGAAEDAVI